MSSTVIKTIGDVGSFVPKNCVDRQVHKTTLCLYPRLTDSMTLQEKNYAFLINVRELSSADIPAATRLSLLSQLMDEPNLVSIITDRYVAFVNKYLRQNVNFTVLSYHDHTGRVISNAIDPATGQLRSAMGVNAANCRPAGIFYAKLACMIDFSTLYPGAKTTHRVTYFISLPLNSKEVTKPDGTPDGQLITFFGEDDWAMNASQVYIDDLWDGLGQVNLPFVLETLLSVATLMLMLRLIWMS